MRQPFLFTLLLLMILKEGRKHNHIRRSHPYKLPPVRRYTLRFTQGDRELRSGIHFHISFYRFAGTYEVPVAVGIVYPGY